MIDTMLVVQANPSLKFNSAFEEEKEKSRAPNGSVIMYIITFLHCSLLH